MWQLYKWNISVKAALYGIHCFSIQTKTLHRLNVGQGIFFLFCSGVQYLDELDAVLDWVGQAMSREQAGCPPHVEIVSLESVCWGAMFMRVVNVMES